MAVVIEIAVAGADRARFDLVDLEVSRALELTGPPAGLMSHLVRPHGDGFLISDVWRSEAEFLDFHGTVLAPAISAADLVPGAPTVSPVWSFARP
jgi:hypothetical protein